MVTWQFYFARRRVTDTRRWAFNRGVTTYEDLQQVLSSLGTTLPSTDEAMQLFLPAPSLVAQATEKLPPVPEPVTVPKQEKARGKDKSLHDKKNVENVKENKANR